MIMKSILISLIVAAYSMTTASCSNGELTRSEAKEKINDAIKNNCERGRITSYAVVSEGSINHLRDLSSPEITYYDALANAGYISRTMEHKENMDWGRKNVWDEYTVKITDKGKEFTIPTLGEGFVKLYCVEVNEITGIRMQDNSANTAIVGYTIKMANQTPFYTLNPKHRSELDAGREYEAIFVKYDDGWRLEPPKRKK